MIGTRRKTAANRMILMASAWVQLSSRARQLLPIRIAPAVAEPRIILDMRKSGVDVAEFLPDPLDEGAHIGAEADLALTGGEYDAVHDIVELGISDILAGALHQILDDTKLGEREIDLLVLPEGAVDIAAQKNVAVPEHHGLAKGTGAASDLLTVSPLVAVENEFDAAGKNLEAARLLDEVDGAAQEPGFFVDLVTENRQKDDGSLDSLAAQLAQYLNARHPRHLPVKQDDVGDVCLCQVVESRRTVLEPDRRVASVGKVLDQRF